MKRWMALLCVVALLGMLAAPPVRAERRAYVFDKAHSQINFVAEATLISAHGYFERFDGQVEIDPDKLEDSTLSLSIETASINTQVAMRDNDLRSARFFDAQNFPTITFASKQITKVDAQNLKITGDLTIRGVTKTVEVPVRIVFLRDGRGRFKGEFQINRHDFKVSYDSRMNHIEDMVTVQFDLNLMDKQMMEERQRSATEKGGQQRQQQPPPAKPPL